MSNENRVTIPGSQRAGIAQGHAGVGPVDPKELAEVTLCLRRSVPVDPHKLRSRDEFAGLHCPSASDMAKVCKFAERHGLDLGDVDDAAATVKLRGCVGDLQRAFGASLHMAHAEGQLAYRTRTGELSLPADVAGIITSVHGLDQRPIARPRFRRMTAGAKRQASSGAQPIYPDQLCTTYAIPPGNGDGRGVFVGIISLGGGYEQSDLRAFCQARGFKTVVPINVSVDGATNSPGDDADVENLLDLQCVIAILQKSGLVNAVPVFFSCPNSGQGFLDGMNAMVAWRDSATGKGLTTASCSWGSSESNNTSMQMTAQDNAAAASVSQGLPWLCAAGDDGSSDGGRGVNVDFMASSPHVLGIGGTLVVLGSNGSRSSETVWGGVSGDGAGGGGLSAVFSSPSYQSSLGLKSRGAPDLAANADPQSGYLIVVDGQWQPIGGTSGATPVTAAALAVVATWLPAQLGYLHPRLYAAESACFDVTVGSNGAYSAGPGYDLCSGLGVPNFTQLQAALLGTAPPVVNPPPVNPPPVNPPPPATVKLPWRVARQLSILLNELEALGIAVNEPATAGQTIGIG